MCSLRPSDREGKDERQSGGSPHGSLRCSLRSLSDKMTIRCTIRQNQQPTSALIAAIQDAQAKKERTVCFVTGVPGAGKTLTGLNAIHDPDAPAQEKRPGVFLSGNGPLVRVVRVALVRDAIRLRGWSPQDARRMVGTFVQNVHTFVDEYTARKPSDGRTPE